MHKNILKYKIISAVIGGSILSVTGFAGATVFAASNAIASNLGTFIITAEGNKAQTFAGGQVVRESQNGVWGSKDYMDTPFSSVAYSSEFINNKQASTVVDVIVNDPSVSDQTLSGASAAWSIRGFKTTQQDVQFNGLYGIAPRFYSGLEGLETVEVRKGPSALLSGMAPNGTIGGTINFVPKRAGATPLTSVTLAYGNGKQFSQQIDWGQRTEDGKYGVRINVLNRKGSTVYEKEQKNDSAVTVGIDAKGERYRASFDFGYAYSRIDNPQYRVTFSNGFLNSATSMLPVSRDAKFGADGTYRTIVEKYGMFKGEYDLNKNWTAYGAVGMRYTSMDYLYNEFQLQSVAGASRVTYRYNNQVNKADAAEIGVRGTVMTGSIKHEIAIAANRTHYTRYMFNRTLNAFTTTLYSPSWKAVTGDLVWREPKNDETILNSLAIADVISTADDQWKLYVGGRFQKVKMDTYNITTGAVATSYDKTAFSPSVGLVHKLNQSVSLYGNYMEGLEMGDIVTDTSASNYGTAFAPYKTKQYEIGAKFDTGKYSTTVSAFSIKRPSLIQNTTTTAYAPNGSVRHRGLEVNVVGEPTKGTRVLGGIAILDAAYQSTAGGAYDGNRVAGISKFTGVLGLEQDIPSVKGLTLTTRVMYNGSAYTNAANTLRVSPWVTWDVGARYAFKAGQTPMTIRADIYNVLNKNYWHALENAVYIGNSRTFALSISADF